MWAKCDTEIWDTCETRRCGTRARRNMWDKCAAEMWDTCDTQNAGHMRHEKKRLMRYENAGHVTRKMWDT